MTKIKMCGLTRIEDIYAVNELLPDYIGFVFAKKSKRYLTPEKATELKSELDPRIKAVGVFTDPTISELETLVSSRVTDLIQLHGNESEVFIEKVKTTFNCPVIKAFKIHTEADVRLAESSSADMILLDSGAGTGNVFDWNLLNNIRRPYFLAGGLNPDNVSSAIDHLHPFCLDLSSGLETNGLKDKNKMTAFTNAVRKETL